jgi:hypothetical protein
MLAAGLVYHSIGRPEIEPSGAAPDSRKPAGLRAIG